MSHTDHFQGQKVKVTGPLWLAVLSTDSQHGHWVSGGSMCDCACMMCIMSSLAGLGRDILWPPPAYTLCH